MSTAVKHLRIPLYIGFCLFVFGAAFFYITGVDIGFHIRTGAYVLETGQIPSENTFSFTHPSAPWLCQQWWPGALFYIIFNRMGISGLIVAKALFAVSMFLLAVLPGKSVSPHNQSKWLFGLVAGSAGVCLARVRFFIRPFMLSGILFALLGLLDRKYSNRWAWHVIVLPVLMVIWANTHAGVMYGFLYLAVQCAIACTRLGLSTYRHIQVPDETNKRKPLQLACIQRISGCGLSVLVSLLSVHVINPSGVRVVLLPLTYFADPFWHSLILEFRGMTLQQDPAFFIVLTALIALQTAARRAWRPELAIPAMIFAVLALRSQRCLLFFVLTAIPYAACLLAHLTRHLSERGKLIIASALALGWTGITLGVFVPDRARPFGIGIAEHLHPLGIYNFMRESVPSQQVFNSMAYGAGMLWWLYPDFRPFVDGRCEAYPKAFWRDTYRPIERGDPLWQAAFATYNITAALVYTGGDYAQNLLIETLHSNPEWTLVAFDDFTQFYLKQTPQNKRVIDNHAYHELLPNHPPCPQSPEQYARVREEATRALTVSSNCRYAHMILAQTEFKTGQWQAAAEAFRKLLMIPNVEPSDAILRDYGYALYCSGALADADRILARVAKQEHTETRIFALHLRHLIAVQQGDNAAAEDFITRAYAINTNNTDVAKAYRAFQKIRLKSGSPKR